MRVTRLHATAAGAFFLLAAATASVRSQQPKIGYDDTPMQPNGKWRVHDGTRPQPPVVVPGVTNDTPVPAPADAIVLLGAGSDLSAWQMTDGAAPNWKMENGVLQVGKGVLQTRQEYFGAKDLLERSRSELKLLPLDRLTSRTMREQDVLRSQLRINEAERSLALVDDLAAVIRNADDTLAVAVRGRRDHLDRQRRLVPRDRDAEHPDAGTRR